MKNCYVYIITNNNNSVIYIGVTNDIYRRIYEHKNKLIPGFSKRYNLHKLIYLEYYNQIEDAIFREKQIKKFSRLKKEELINKLNPNWIDIFEDGQIPLQL
ncbi:MAG TPA: GIY-YIG nuclease [Eubacteriaceae bacterium]|jgi:putative endonuclease|nr:GIY-YIG nuclease [Eubacteriaceae bacterium]